MALRRHLRILAGGIDPAGSRCAARALSEAPNEEAIMTPALKVAFATSDRHQVDQHFGAASALLIYEVDPEQARVVEFAQFGELDQDGHESKLAAKFALLQGCAVVYCQAVGGSAIQQLLALGVQPMRIEAGAPIAPLLAELQTALRGDGGPAWLRRIVARQRQADTDGSRFAAMEAEGWRD
ncbi:MAG TPA: nitrogen fixation protein NifX [Candidatus Competibacteraceae bacterium]|nr:nitrogen fixation protein NifX [Candidatus Competibacteraceae bacterium]